MSMGDEHGDEHGDERGGGHAQVSFGDRAPLSSVIKARPRRRTGPPPYSTTSTRKTRTLLQSECTQIDSNPAPSVCKSEVVPLGHPACANYLLRASYRRAASVGAAFWPGFLGAGAIPLTGEVDFPRKPKMH